MHVQKFRKVWGTRFLRYASRQTYCRHVDHNTSHGSHRTSEVAIYGRQCSVLDMKDPQQPCMRAGAI